MSNCFTQSHPECQDDEIYLGNFNIQDFVTVGHKTKRRGNKPLDTNGNEICAIGFYPVFVKITELEELGLYPKYIK